MNFNTYFPPTPVDESSTPRAVLIQNTGFGDLVLTDPVFSGSSMIAIDSIPPEGFTIPTNYGISVSGVFNPTDTGERSRSVRFNTNDVENPVLTVNFNGIGIAPFIRVFGPSLTEIPMGGGPISFGSKYHGEAVLLTFTITNNGSAPLSSLTVSAGGDFVVTRQPDTSVDPSMTTTFDIAYLPASTSGVSGDSASVSSNDTPRSPFGFSLSGTSLGVWGGTGTPPELPSMVVKNSGGTPISSVSFADTNVGNTTTVEITVENSGVGLLVASMIAITDDTGGDFNVSPPSLSVSPSGSEVISLEFTPLTSGAKTAELSLTTNDPSNPVFTLNLEGTAI